MNYQPTARDQQPESQLTQQNRFDLKSRFPISKLFIVKDSLSWILAAVAVLTFAVWVNYHEFFSITNAQFLSELDIEIETFVLGLLLVLMVKITHAALVRRTYKYFLDQGHLVIRKGIITGHKGSYPLSRITDVYSMRSLQDCLLGLHTIVICTPTAVSEDFAQIPGLRSETADQLSKLILRAVEEYQLNNREVETALYQVQLGPKLATDSLDTNNDRANPTVGTSKVRLTQVTPQSSLRQSQLFYSRSYQLLL